MMRTFLSSFLLVLVLLLAGCGQGRVVTPILHTFTPENLSTTVPNGDDRETTQPGPVPSITWTAVPTKISAVITADNRAEEPGATDLKPGREPQQGEPTAEPAEEPRPATPSPYNTGQVIYIQDRLNAATYFYVYPDLRGARGYVNPDQILASPGPNSPGSGNLSFANFEPKIAYVDEQKTLWIADLKNRTPLRVHSFDSVGEQEIRLIWTPDDRHLIIDIHSRVTPNMIYHLDNGQLEAWDYVCDRLAVSGRTQKLAVWCVPAGAGNGPAVIEWGGDIWHSDQDPKGQVLLSVTAHEEDYRYRLFPLYNHAGWSSDGALLAYFDPKDKTGALKIARANGNVMMSVLQKAYWLSNLFETPQYLPGSPIQWSKTGDRLLVFAVGDAQKPCPTVSFMVGSGEEAYKNPGCWQVYDPYKGELVWSSAQFFSQHSDIFEPKFGEAAISEDGRMVGFFAYVYGYDPRLYVIALDQNELLQEAPLYVEKMRWGPE